MLGDFDPSLGGGLSQPTKVFVRRNGHGGPWREVKLHPDSRVSDLLEKACKVLDLDNPQRVFHSNGVECIDVNSLEADKSLYISCGEAFISAPKGDRLRDGQQVVGDYVLTETVGKGGFGSVMKGVHLETAETVAVKFVPKRSFRQMSDLQRVFQEIQCLRNIRHPNVIRILDVADNPDSVCFIMEYAAGGELRGYVERRKELDENDTRRFFKQIVRAVHYIHSKNIIHRDLKLENILLDSQNRCKIVDFGLSDFVSSKERTVTDAGTEAYLAPEVYHGHSADSDPYKIDVWGMGVILYAMAHGVLPFSRPDRETCARLETEGLQFKPELSADYRRLVGAMLTVEPEKRASVSEISLDPWLNAHRFDFFGGDEIDDLIASETAPEGGALSLANVPNIDEVDFMGALHPRRERVESFSGASASTGGCANVVQEEPASESDRFAANQSESASAGGSLLEEMVEFSGSPPPPRRAHTTYASTGAQGQGVTFSTPRRRRPMSPAPTTVGDRRPGPLARAGAAAVGAAREREGAAPSPGPTRPRSSPRTRRHELHSWH